jgi:hypothetical protein
MRSRSTQVVTPDDFAAAAAELMARRQDGFPPGTPKTGQRTRGPALDKTKACPAIARRYMEARLSGDPARIAAAEGEFTAGTCDPAWATTISEYLIFFGPSGQRREVPYVPPSRVGDRVIRLKNGARIALVADWGTGTGPALDVLKHISTLAPDVLIHLGDVYYSGTPGEYKLAFSDPISNLLGTDRSSLPVFALSGNLDMYCGGIGYYRVCPVSITIHSNRRQASSAYELKTIPTRCLPWTPVLSVRLKTC